MRLNHRSDQSQALMSRRAQWSLQNFDREHELNDHLCRLQSYVNKSLNDFLCIHIGTINHFTTIISQFLCYFYILVCIFTATIQHATEQLMSRERAHNCTHTNESHAIQKVLQRYVTDAILHNVAQCTWYYDLSLLLFDFCSKLIWIHLYPIYHTYINGKPSKIWRCVFISINTKGR